MEFDPLVLAPRDMYRFMIDVIVPRPIAFVTTVSPAGRVNAAPFSFFSGISGVPPLLGISILERRDAPKDSLRNIRDTGEFVVNVVHERIAAAMVRASGDWPPEVDEVALTGLTPLPATRVRPPRIAESPVQLECRLHREVPLGASVLVVGEIVLGHAGDEVMTADRVDIAKLRPVGRLGGEGYCYVHETFESPRPRVDRATGREVPPRGGPA